MLPVRPPKRAAETPATDATQDASSSSSSRADHPGGTSVAGLGKTKFRRTSSPQKDFSAQVKDRLSQHTRTIQACDRCKIRKIRCDALPDGCSPCSQNKIVCWVTDRVTQVKMRRGYIREAEQRKSSMQDYIRDLEHLLGENGIEVKPWEDPDESAPEDGKSPTSTSANDDQSWAKIRSVWVRKPTARPSSSRSSLTRPSVLESRPADRHLGLGSDNAAMSSMMGTKLTVFGATIDLTSFDVPDMDEPSPDSEISKPLYNKSIQSLLQSTMNINPPCEVSLPSRDEAFKLAAWYFLTIFPFFPLLHKPTFLSTLASTYDDAAFKPSVPERVMIHMVFAMMYYQQAVRDPSAATRKHLNELSNRHYHFALGKFFDLASSPTLPAIQALTLIAVHSRSFPKPGCASLVGQFALHKAIDMKLHRATKPTGKPTDLDTELRRRAWWTLLALSVTIGGRLGRPMAITNDEYDVDFPEPVADEHLTADGVDTSAAEAHCGYHVGLACFKLVPLYIQLYNTVYSVKCDSERYQAVVAELEEKFQQWKRELPESLRSGGSSGDDSSQSSRMLRLYAESIEAEFQLCLRHPSVAMTSDPQVCAENTRICENAATNMLRAVKQMAELKSLDMTWYQMSVYIAAMFTTLVAHWGRKESATPKQLTDLSRDMKDWMAIIHEVASTLGAGSKITMELDAMVKRTLTWMQNPEEAQHQKQTSPVSRKVAEPPKPAATQPSKADDITLRPPKNPRPAKSSVPSASVPRDPNPPQSPRSGYSGQLQPPNDGQQPLHDGQLGYGYSNLGQRDNEHMAGSNTGPFYTSQPPQHIIQPAEPVSMAGMIWPAQGTNWQEWMNAMMDPYASHPALNMPMAPAGHPGHGPGAGVHSVHLPPYHGESFVPSLDTNTAHGTTSDLPWPMGLWNPEGAS